MTDSITPIQTATQPIDTPAMQFAHASALAASNQANEANIVFLTDIAQAEVANYLSVLDGSPPNAQTNVAANDSLLSTDNLTLSLFNELVTTPTKSSTITGLTSEQMQEISILQHDALALETTTTITNPIPLTTAASTVDLSTAAQSIANGVSTVAPASTVIAAATATPVATVAPANNVTTPTPVQLQQIAAIIAPVADQPLNQALLLQIQAQALLAGISPQLLSMSAIFLAQNYLAGVHTVANTDNTNEEIVTPVSSIDRVAIEDSAIIT